MARRKKVARTPKRRASSRSKKVDLQTVAMVILGGAAGYVAASFLSGIKQVRDMVGENFAPIAAGAGVAGAAAFLLPDRTLGFAAAAGAAAPLAAGVAKITKQAWFPGPTGMALGNVPEYFERELEIPLRGPDLASAFKAMHSVGVTNAGRMLAGASEQDPLRGSAEEDPLRGDMPLRRAPTMQRTA